MGEPTPALARATEALRRCTCSLPGCIAADAEQACAVVSAALHDPDDPAWLQRVEEAHAYQHASDDNSEVRCACGHVLWKVGTGFTGGPVVSATPGGHLAAALARHRITVVLAAILGGQG